MRVCNRGLYTAFIWAFSSSAPGRATTFWAPQKAAPTQRRHCYIPHTSISQPPPPEELSSPIASLRLDGGWALRHSVSQTIPCPLSHITRSPVVRVLE